MTQDRDIKYVNKDFTDYRNQLIEFSKSYFPDSYNDFSPASPGMMFIEMAAYVGDILSFYQDIQLQETYIQYAKDPGSLYTMAYMLGYRPKITAASEANIEISQTVGAIGGSPNWDQALQIAPNTRLSATSGNNVKFIIDTPIDFNFSSSYDPTDVLVASLSGNVPSTFTLTKTVKAISGELKTSTEVIAAAEKFKTIVLSDANIIGIESITDSNGNTWYEVPFLGQDTIFVDNTNSSSDKSQVSYLLTLQRVPRRFTTRFDSNGNLSIQFGAGINGQDDSVITPDPTNVGFGINTGISRIDYAYDPSNFLSTKAYGLAPSNTTLTITYIVGGGVASNVPSNTITNVDVITVSATDTTYQTSIIVNNPEAATGGSDGDSVEDLRQNSMRAFNEQGRAVTLPDYTVRALSMPTKYGSIAKVFVTQDQLTNSNLDSNSIVDSNSLALSMYTLAYDINNKLTTSSINLVNNLKQYLSQYMVITDAINMRDAFVVNIEVDFDIIIKPNYTGRNVLLDCTTILKDYFNITNWNINQPINLSDIYTLLDKVKGVQTVQKINIINKVGGDYSQYGYDIVGATRKNVVYPSYDPMIFEVKFPDLDIKGRITTI